MKRAITFLTILLCASAAFCASLDIHTIKLKTNVGSVAPAFQLVFTSGMKEPAQIITNSSKNEFADGSVYDEYATNETSVEVADISKEDLNLVFTARLANKAKTTGTYTLKFNAGSFEVTRNEVPGTLDPSEVTVSAATGIESLLSVATGTVVPGESIQMRFIGGECEPGDLAVFSVTYLADAKLDPTKDGFYYADISMEITTDK